jgi:nitrite reductase/ring-hydroxylating ferredoxin subunit
MDACDRSEPVIDWVHVCHVTELAPGTARRIETDPPVAVFNVDGTIYATDDTCTHSEASLADGYIDGDEVECPLHFAKFCIRTGEVLCLPARRALGTYRVVVDDDEIFVGV